MSVRAGRDFDLQIFSLNLHMVRNVWEMIRLQSWCSRDKPASGFTQVAGTTFQKLEAQASRKTLAPRSLGQE